MPQKYINLIKNSLESIEPNYYRLVTADNNHVVRERVFCYELYHQMRLKQINFEQDLVLQIHGEVDKRGHEDFKEKDQKNPDFIFHQTGVHQNNMLVIEVKGKLRTRKEITNDIDKLITFIDKYYYKAGVFILYNHSICELVNFLGEELNPLSMKPSAKQVYIVTITADKRQCSEDVLANLCNVSE